MLKLMGLSTSDPADGTSSGVVAWCVAISIAFTLTMVGSASAYPFVVSVEKPAEAPFLPPDRAVLGGDTGTQGLSEIQTAATEATISSDGSRVAYVEGYAAFGSNPSLRLVTEPFAGGARNVVREVDKPEGVAIFDLHDPSFSPDGTKIAMGCEVGYYTRSAPKSSTRAEGSTCLAGVEEVNSDGTGASALVPSDSVQTARYIDDGEGVTYSQPTSSGHSTAIEMDRSGENVHDLPAIPGVADLRHPVPSPDGTQLVVSGVATSDGNRKTYVYDVEQQSARALASSELRRPAWTPDGKSVAYVTGSGVYQVNVATGTVSVVLTSPVSSGGTTYTAVTSIAFPQPRGADNLAQRFRPNLYFDTSERFRPLNVARFFREKDLLGGPLHRACTGMTCVGLLSTDNLRSFPGNEDHLDIGQVGGGYASPDAACRQDGRADCNDGPATTMYYNTTDDRGDGYLYADYWYFTRLNDFPAGAEGDHQGDWEGVTLAFSGGLQSPTFDFAQFSQHGKWYRYLRGTLQCDGKNDDSCGDTAAPRGQRLTVYVANGSHANYPRGCGRSPSQVPLCGRVLAPGDHVGTPVSVGEAGYDGERPWGENGRGRLTSLAKFPLADGWQEGQQQNWTDWPGRWGRVGQDTPADAPRSPGRQAHYFDPGDAWCVIESSSSCQGLPSGRRAATPLAEVASRGEKSCEPWLGGDVVAAVCQPAALTQAVRRRHLGRRGELTLGVSGSPGFHSANAPGITQATGEPLRPGQSLRVSGRMGAGARLYVRVRVGRKLFDLAFRRPGSNSSFTVRADRGAAPVLQTRAGRVLTAVATSEQRLE